jgi:maltose O-acetyltransferase
MQWRIVVCNAAGSWLVPRTLRWAIYRACGLRIDTRAISAGCFFSGPTTIGRGTFINTGCMFDAFAPIKVGERCSFGMRVTLITSTHAPGDAAQRAGALAGKPIRIGDGTWVGACATILPGVMIGEGCVIAAGAVVTSDCEPHHLYAGVPARPVRRLDASNDSSLQWSPALDVRVVDRQTGAE